MNIISPKGTCCPSGVVYPPRVLHKADTHMRLAGIEKGRFLPIPTCKHVLWVKALPDYEPLFSILDGMRQNTDRRFWIERLEAQENNNGIEADSGQMSTRVEILL